VLYSIITEQSVQSVSVTSITSGKYNLLNDFIHYRNTIYIVSDKRLTCHHP